MLKIFGFLLLLLSPITSNPIATKDRDEYIKNLNEFRRAYAFIYDVPFMNEMVYDENLYKESDIHHRDDIDSYYIKSCSNHSREMKTILEAFQSLTKQTNREIINATVQSFKDYVESKQAYLNHHHKQIRCDEKVSWTKCVLGPTRGFWWRFSIEAGPGSMCEYGYYDNNGLCSKVPDPVSSTTTNVPSTRKRFSEDDDEEEEECDCSSSSGFQILLVLILTVIFHSSYLFD